MDKRFECLQEGKSDCAIACISSIIKYYGGYMTLDEIKKSVKCDKSGTNAYDIVEGAKAIGFDCIGKKANLEELITMKEACPFIVHTKKDNYYHFVVVYGFNKNKVILMDPSIGFIKKSIPDFEKSYLKTVILFSKVKPLLKMPKDNKLLKKFISIIFKNKKLLIFTSFISLMVFILSILEIGLYNYLLNLNVVSNISKVVLIFLMFVLTKNVFDYLRNYLIIKIKYNLDTNLMHETYKSILSLPSEQYKNKTTGETISRINDLDMLKDLILHIGANIFVNILLIISCFIFLLYINVYLALISLISSVIYLLISLYFKSKYNSKIRMIQESKGLCTNNLIETIEGIESINNLNIKDYRINKLDTNYTSLSKEVKKYNLFNTTEHLLKNISFDSSIFLIIVSSILLSNINAINNSQIIVIYMIYNYLFSTLKGILDTLPDLSFAFSNLEKVNSIFRVKEIKEEDRKINSDIVIENLKYTNHYVDILKDVNIRINKNDKVFIEGESGSGKSTLLKLIMKHKSSYEGKIYIGREELSKISESVINNSFTYISQNEKIFTDTLENNLILNRNVDKDKLSKVINICRIDKIIKKRKLKMDFQIDEDGFNISGGEKQRIILARALLKDSNYLLIDEALSEVDLSLETEIVKDILKEFKDKTIIYVSHKREMKKLFDKVINIERRNND